MGDLQHELPLLGVVHDGESDSEDEVGGVEERVCVRVRV
jgi:hypothetical protein